MGTHANIGIDTFPRQGGQVGSRARLCFHYDAGRTVDATIVRSCDEEPWVLLFHLADGRYVLATECQWQPLNEVEGT